MTYSEVKDTPTTIPLSIGTGTDTKPGAVAMPQENALPEKAWTTCDTKRRRDPYHEASLVSPPMLRGAPSRSGGLDNVWMVVVDRCRQRSIDLEVGGGDIRYGHDVLLLLLCRS